DLGDGAHALRPRLGQERTMRLADPHEPGVSREPDDQLAHAADRRRGRADRLGQGNGQHVRIECADLHSLGRRGDDTPEEGQIGGGSRGPLARTIRPRYSRRATTKGESSDELFTASRRALCYAARIRSSVLLGRTDGVKVVLSSEATKVHAF